LVKEDVAVAALALTSARAAHTPAILLKIRNIKNPLTLYKNNFQNNFLIDELFYMTHFKKINSQIPMVYFPSTPIKILQILIILNTLELLEKSKHSNTPKIFETKFT
jgi:hypothetical protein